MSDRRAGGSMNLRITAWMCLVLCTPSPSYPCDKNARFGPIFRERAEPERLERECAIQRAESCPNPDHLEDPEHRIEEAGRFRSQVCHGGNLNACIGLAAVARAFHEKECSEGKMASCTKLGTLEWESGHRAVARLLWTRACNAMNANACRKLKETPAE